MCINHTFSWPPSSIVENSFNNTDSFSNFLFSFHKLQKNTQGPSYVNFLFWTNFRLTEKLQKQDRVSMYPFPASSDINILRKHCTVIKTRKLTLAQYYYLNYRPYLNFTCFSTNAFFLIRIQSKTPHWIQLLFHLYSPAVCNIYVDFVFHDLYWICPVFSHD